MRLSRISTESYVTDKAQFNSSKHTKTDFHNINKTFLYRKIHCRMELHFLLQVGWLYHPPPSSLCVCITASTFTIGIGQVQISITQMVLTFCNKQVNISKKKKQSKKKCHSKMWNNSFVLSAIFLLIENLNEAKHVCWHINLNHVTV